MHELPLLIFTCGLELAVGLLAIVAVASFVDKEGNYKVAACISVALAIVAMLGSLLHLGVPLKSVFAITRSGGSRLATRSDSPARSWRVPCCTRRCASCPRWAAR